MYSPSLTLWLQPKVFTQTLPSSGAAAHALAGQVTPEGAWRRCASEGSISSMSSRASMAGVIGCAGTKDGWYVAASRQRARYIGGRRLAANVDC